MVCGTCGTTNPTGQKFCGECGSLLAAPATEVRKTVTVVFCDLVGSTALGESVDAEVLRGVMGGFHAELRRVLEQHGGTVEKFVGDAAMAVFGVPQLHEDDALRAVRAAVRMREAATALGLEVRIGVNTGEVVVGTGETLATGDAVNVAARLEQAAAAGTILVGEQTARLVRGHVALEPVEPLVLKGKAQPVPAYTVAALDDDAAEAAEWSLVGRDHELAVLEDACRQAAEKRVPQLVTVVGHPGVGKSRLVAELLARVAGQHLVGHCLPYGEGITYWPLIEILESLGDLDDALAGANERDAVTVRLAAALGTAGAAATAEEIAWAFRRLLETLARDRLVVVVLDDIHWAEPTMLDLVEHVASLARDAALVLLCTARPDLYDARPGWASPRPAATTLTLDALGPEQAAALARELGVESEADLVRIVEASDGNPLFVQQLIAVGREGDGSAHEVPPDLQALLAARIDRLEEPERQVIERAAVEGRLFHRGAVTELLPPPQRPEVARCLVGLVRRELVRPDQALIHGDDGFRFGHMLIRDAAYDSIAKRVRADLHERYADWLLERLGAEAPQEIVGHHLAQAHAYRRELGEESPELRDRAAAVLAAAARAAAERRDVTAAATLFERALALTPDDPPRRHMLLDYVPVMRQRGHPETESLIAEVVELARTAGDDRSRWIAEVHLAQSRIQRGADGAVTEAEGLVEKVLSTAAHDDDDLVLAHVWGLQADLEGMRGRMGAALDAVDHGFRHGRACGSHQLQVQMAHHLAGAVVYGPVSVVEGRRRMAQLEEELGHDPAIQGITRHVRAHLDAREGHFEGATESLAAWRQHFREMGMERYFAITASCEWDIARLTGDVERGERELREGFAILERMGDRLILCTMAASLGEASLRRGDLDDADRYASLSQEYGDPDDYQNEASWRGVRARVLSARGRHDEAVTVAGEAVALAATTDEIEQEASNRDDLAHVLRAAGRPERAAAEAAAARALYERKGNIVAASRMSELIEELGQS
jgi:class 3 adenylate cyclase/tetratricopeptide (TPR) repeat protein